MSKIDKAMRILLAGFCINLCLGILYAWSVFNKALHLTQLQPSLSLSVFLLQASYKTAWVHV